jgi:hypothetical protein
LGVVQISTVATSGYTALGNLTEWSYNQTSERIDASVMGSCTKAFEAGAIESIIEVACFWDGDNAPQALLDPGDTVHLRIYPEGTGSGANWYKTPTAGAVVLSVERSGGGVDGIVSLRSTLAVNGGMTATAVP